MADKETGKRVRKPVIVKQGGSVTVDPKTGKVTSNSAEPVETEKAAGIRKGEASDAESQ